jgi:hypothetical protein
MAAAASEPVMRRPGIQRNRTMPVASIRRSNSSVAFDIEEEISGRAQHAGIDGASSSGFSA